MTRTPYQLNDPTVQALGTFLQAAPLADGRTTTGLTSPTTELLAQSILNFGQGLIWSEDRWIDKALFDSLPDVGDVEIQELADGQVIKMTQRSTGLSALGESHDDAWNELRRKAAQHG